uniref:Uncharacterized protein n=1 Tax=Nelumbo nucifera TaxID=4432 RepID=A0A822XLG4_NELNU|nr:TPA_asm: hypothetical protein HUJ06_022683 [Nelumbo nucifera]
MSSTTVSVSTRPPPPSEKMAPFFDLPRGH